MVYTGKYSKKRMFRGSIGTARPLIGSE